MDTKRPLPRAKFASIDLKTAAVIDQRAKEVETLTGRYNFSQAIAMIVKEWQASKAAQVAA